MYTCIRYNDLYIIYHATKKKRQESGLKSRNQIEKDSSHGNKLNVNK